MKLLLELYPGDFWALLTANVLLQIAVVVLLACVLVVGIARRAPATRHAIWLCALVCVVCSPILAFTLNGLGITLIPVRPASRSEVGRADHGSGSRDLRCHGPRSPQPGGARDLGPATLVSLRSK